MHGNPGEHLRRPGLLAVAAVAAAALAGCGGTPTGSGAPPSAPVTVGTSVSPTTVTTTASHTSTSRAPTGSPECASADLALSLAPTEGTAGTFYTAVQLTNAGRGTCFVAGFPGVSYVDGSGHQVGAAAVRDGAKGPRVTLKPGGMASAVLAMVDIGVFSPSACRPTPVTGLRVYPPDQRASLFVRHPTTGCAAADPGEPQLRVRTLVAGATGM